MVSRDDNAHVYDRIKSQHQHSTQNITSGLLVYFRNFGLAPGTVWLEKQVAVEKANHANQANICATDSVAEKGTDRAYCSMVRACATPHKRGLREHHDFVHGA